MPEEILKKVQAGALSLIAPVPYASAVAFSHTVGFYGITARAGERCITFGDVPDRAGVRRSGAGILSAAGTRRKGNLDHRQATVVPPSRRVAGGPQLLPNVGGSNKRGDVGSPSTTTEARGGRAQHERAGPVALRDDDARVKQRRGSRTVRKGRSTGVVR